MYDELSSADDAAPVKLTFPEAGVMFAADDGVEVREEAEEDGVVAEDGNGDTLINEEEEEVAVEVRVPIILGVEPFAEERAMRNPGVETNGCTKDFPHKMTERTSSSRSCT